MSDQLLPQTIVDVEYAKSVALIVGIFFNLIIGFISLVRKESIMSAAENSVKSFFSASTAATTAGLIVILYIGIQLTSNGALASQIVDLAEESDPETQIGKEKHAVGINYFVGVALLVLWLVGSGTASKLAMTSGKFKTSVFDTFGMNFGRGRKRCRGRKKC